MQELQPGAYKGVLLVDQPVDAEVGVDEDGQGDHQLHHALQDGVVEQFIIESKLFAEFRENLNMQSFCSEMNDSLVLVQL